MVISVVRSVTGRSSLPRERPLQGGRRRRHIGGACHQAYWQSVSKATGRRVNNRSRDRRVPVRKEKSTLLRIPGNKRERYLGGGGQQSTGSEQDRTKKIGAEYIVAFCYCGSLLGMSQHQDWHLNLVQYERGE